MFWSHFFAIPLAVNNLMHSPSSPLRPSDLGSIFLERNKTFETWKCCPLDSLLGNLDCLSWKIDFITILIAAWYDRFALRILPKVAFWSYWSCFPDHWLAPMSQNCPNPLFIGSLGNIVFERRTLPGSGPFAWLGGGLFETRINRHYKRKETQQYKFVSVKEYKREKGSLQVDFCRTSRPSVSDASASDVRACVESKI